MNNHDGYDPRDQPLYRTSDTTTTSTSNFNEGQYSYGSYEQHDRGNFGGIDPNIADYEDDFDNDHDNGEYGLNNECIETEYGHYSDNQDGPGPEILLSILETALEDHRNETLRAATPASPNTSFTSISKTHSNREQLEQTWKAIRTHWLWAHDTIEERSFGARCRSDQGLAPLHLICKLASNPPTDILEEIVLACPEAAEWEDDHGWLPLHHACIHGASTEVLKLLTEVYPRSKIALDAHHRTPLHLYATRGTLDPYNPKTLATNFGLLCSCLHDHNDHNDDNNNDDNNDDDESYGLSSSSPAEIQDRAGMLPMHYACAYGTTQSVLKILDEAFPNSLEARDDHGRTPLHFVMVNAQRSASPGVLGYLLGHYYYYHDEEDQDHKSLANHNPGVVSVNVRDGDGNLPLHLLNLGLVGTDFDQHPEKLDQLSECLALYLDAEPHVSTDFLAALQVLPDPLRDVGVVHPHVRRILNDKIIQRFPTSILMLDGIMLVTMIVCFELATTRFVDQIVGGDENDHLSSALVMLYVTAAYFFLRELIQVIASLALGAFDSWLYDTTNWLDVLVIALVAYYTTAMTLGDPQDYNHHDNFDNLGGFRTGTALTKGVLWTAVIFFLKSTQVDFAVFLNGVFYVVRRLVAFLLAMVVILISFAQMFWLVYLEQPVCKFSCPVDDNQCEAEMEGCNYPHCEFGDSFLKVYTMMMGEIGTETRYDQNLVAQILYILYGFFIVILLSNVLIAIVTDSYEIVQNDRAAIVFWSNRLDFVAEMDSIAAVVRKRIFGCQNDGGKNRTLPSSDTLDDRSYGESISQDVSFPNATTTTAVVGRASVLSVEWFRDHWTSVVSMFEHDVYASSEDLRPVDFWYEILNKTLAVLVIPPWLILGFVTVGILWPPQVREWLFVQTETAASRAQIERRKLEQLQEIQTSTKLLKEELKQEMQHDRDEMFRMKAEVDAVQEEVLADLQQVNALVTTLLTDLGGIPLEG